MTRLGILGLILFGLGLGFLIFQNWDAMIFLFVMSGISFLFSYLLWVCMVGESE